jgi:hypothetical protein
VFHRAIHKNINWKRNKIIFLQNLLLEIELFLYLSLSHR